MLQNHGILGSRFIHRRGYQSILKSISIILFLVIVCKD